LVLNEHQIELSCFTYIFGNCRANECNYTENQLYWRIHT